MSHPSRPTETDVELLDQLTTFVRETTQAFFDATSRDDVETIVRDRFRDTELYTAGRIVEQLPAIALAEREQREAAWTVSSKAIRLDEPEVADDGLALRQRLERADGDDGTWAFVSLEAGRTVYGGLVIHATRPDAFDDRELAALEWFGDTISHAINAVENRRLLFENAVTEIRIECADTPLQTVSERAACRLSLESFVPATDDRILAYCTARSTPADEVTKAAAPVEEIEACRPINADGSAVVEFTITDGSPLFAFVEGMANVSAVRADERACTVVAEISSGTCAVPTLERIHDYCADATLIAKRDHDLPPSSLPNRVAPPAESLASLTERQREVLEAAYRSGYFRWPREATAEEVAESLGVSSPTFHKHLRRAQARLLEDLLESTSGTKGSSERGDSRGRADSSE